MIFIISLKLCIRLSARSLNIRLHSHLRLGLMGIQTSDAEKSVHLGVTKTSYFMHLLRAV